MERIRIGIIGLGGMGTNHAKYLLDGEVPEARLAAVMDLRPERLDWARENLPPDVKRHPSAQSLIGSGDVDGVIIATPHFDHPRVAVQAFQAGLHVLTEKPAGVATDEVRAMNRAAAASGRVFGIMYNQRANPPYARLKEMIRNGELGQIKRSNWIITSWYRSQSYYDSGGWRATWAGEGGGVLLNQDPHQLDLWQWLCGMPSRVRAFCEFGKWHDIEVEDDVTAYVTYPDGATGVFVTSTGDAPGTNRLEISADMGKVVVEDGKLTFWKLETPERKFNREYKDGFGEPKHTRIEIPLDTTVPGHSYVTRDWVRSILTGSPLLSPGEEGIRGLEISNAMHLSTWLDRWISLPLDDALFRAELDKRIAGSRANKGKTDRVMDVKGSFGA